MTTIDRSTEPEAVFAARLAGLDARPVVDPAADAAVENVAKAMFAAAHPSEDWLTGYPEDMRNYFRRLAEAALSAAPPADETLRERKLARLRQLAEQWSQLSHWDYKGSPKVAEARAEGSNDAARIVLNVLDGGDLL